MIFPAQRCENGLPMEILSSLDSLEAEENTAVEALIKLLEYTTPSVSTRKRRLSTQELALPNNKRICRDRSKTSNERTPNTRSSRTSLQVSTSNAKAFKPFWNTLSGAWSKKLSSCTVTDLQDLDLNSLNLSSRNLMSGSWYTVKMKQNQKALNESLQTTSLQLQQYLSRLITDAEQQKIVKREKESKSPHPIVRCRKIRVYPSPEQRQVLDRWFGTVRFVYNKCVEKYPASNIRTSRAELRKCTPKDLEWLKNVPYDVRDSAILDVDGAKKAGKAKKQRGHLKFRSKKHLRSESFRIRGRDWGRKRGVYSDLFAKDKLKSSEELPEKLSSTMEVVRTRLGEYFVCIPREVEMNKSENQALNVVSLDPGVRTFQTTYDAAGVTTEWGNGDCERIIRLCKHVDEIQSKMKSVSCRKRRNLKRAKLRLHNKVKALVKELHHKLALWLCKKYKVVLLPKFDTQNMVKTKTKSGKRRAIGCRTARMMCTWSHYKFRQILLEKAEVWDTEVIICDEQFTSKTCGSCGELNRGLGRAKMFKCGHCGYEADRDINGARNILLRYLTLKEIAI